jgi:hypothetical protein
MPIDASKVQWDSGPIDLGKVQWDQSAPALEPAGMDIAGGGAGVPGQYAELPAAPAGAGASPGARWAGIASRALAPYATAAGAGAVAGSPIGGIGAIPGAAAGMGALALTDLGTSIYNLAATPFGFQAVPTGSEAIRNLYGKAGVGVAPETPGEKMFAAGLEGGAGALGGAGAARTLANTLAAGRAQRAANFMAAAPGTQAVAGAGGAIAPTALQEYGGVENPLALGAASLGGAMLAGKVGPALAERGVKLGEAARRIVTGANVGRQQLAQQADQLFDAARASGVAYTPQSFDNFAQEAGRVANQIDPRTQLSQPVRDALAEIENFRGTPNDIRALHDLRQSLSQQANAPGLAPRAGSVIRQMRDQLDDYLTTPANMSAPNLGGEQLMEGIGTYSRLMKSDRILEIAEKAAQNQTGTFASSVRTQFKQLAQNPKQLARFTPDEQETIRAIAKGASENAVLQFMSQMAPSISLSGAVRAAVPAMVGGYGYMSGSPELMALGGTLGAAGLGARGLRNVMANQTVNQLAAGIRRGDVRPPMFTPALEIGARAVPQALIEAQQFR